MNSFADLQKISSYSVALGEKLCANFYRKKSVVTGPDIKNFTQVEQINLFIFKNLFEKWQEETNRLKSPYFDYTIEPVQDALKKLLNTLSNHIAISKEFFKPILFKAIEDTLLLALMPHQYLEKEFANTEVIKPGYFQKTSKFFKINRSILTAVDKVLSSKEEVSKDELLNYLRDQQFEEEQTKSVIQEISQLIQIELNEVLFEPLIKEVPEAEDKAFSTATEKAAEEEATEVSNNNHVPKEQKEIQQPVYKTEETGEREVPKPEFKKESEELSLNDRYIKQEITLNDLLAKSAKGESEPKITDLRSAVPLNQKFIYIKELFGDDPASYAVAISELEKLQSLEEALNLLKLEYSPKYNWDFNSNDVKEFVRLVERRFL